MDLTAVSYCQGSGLQPLEVVWAKGPGGRGECCLPEAWVAEMDTDKRKLGIITLAGRSGA